MTPNCMGQKLLQGKKSILDQSFDRWKLNEESNSNQTINGGFKSIGIT